MCRTHALRPPAYAADRVERRGYGKDLGHATRSVRNRELRQPRTRADGEPRHGEQPEPLRARASTPPICTDGDFVAITSRGAPIGLFCSNELPRGQPERHGTAGSMLDRARSRELRGVGSGGQPLATFNRPGQTGQGSAPSERSERRVLAQRVGPTTRSGGSFGPPGGWPGCASMVHRPRVGRGRMTKPRRWSRRLCGR
jgi:hypothetical protein